MLHSRHSLVRPGVCLGRQKNTLVGLDAHVEQGELVPLSHPVGIALTD